MRIGLPTLIQVFLLAYVLWSFMEMLMKTRHPAGTLPFYLLPAWYVVIFYTVVDYQLYGWTIIYSTNAWTGSMGIGAFMAGSLVRYAVVKTVRGYDDRDIPVDTGLFARLRYPLFTAYLVQLAGIVICFGSGGGLLGVIFVCIPLILLSIREQDRFYPLENQALFDAYRSKVKYRLIPGVW